MENDVKKGAETKPATFRFSDEDVQKFKEMAAESGISQSEMFAGLMNTYQMDKAKSNIPDRAKEIEIFQITAERLKEMFLTSLEINQTSEDRIRETLNLELKTKDQTIADLQEYKTTNIITIKERMKEIEALQGAVTEGDGLLSIATGEINEKAKTVIQQREQIDTLNALVTEYKGYRDENKIITGLNVKLTSENLRFANDNEKANNELASEREKVDFYTRQVETAKVEVKEIRNDYKQQIEKVTIDHKQEIADIKEDYKKQSEKTISDHKQELSIIKEDYKQQIEKLVLDHKQEIIDIKEDYKHQIIDLKADFKTDKTEAVSNANAIANREIQALLAKYDSLMGQLPSN